MDVDEWLILTAIVVTVLVAAAMVCLGVIQLLRQFQ